MSILSFLLPNWNSALPIAIALVLFGMFLIWVASLIPWKVTKNRVRTVGVFIILAGIAYWFGASFIQDIFSDNKVLMTVAAAILLIVIGTILFFPEKKAKKKR